MEKETFSFGEWLFSKQEIVEKTFGLGVLFLEILSHIREFWGAGDEEVTTILNLFFLIYIFFILRSELKRRYSIQGDNQEIQRVLRLSSITDKSDKIDRVLQNSNTFISQLKNINYFILAEAAVYFFLLIEGTIKSFVNKDQLFTAISHIFHLTSSQDAKTVLTILTQSLHLCVDSSSYLAAFFLLRCFFVMYLPTVDIKGNDILKKKTNVFWIVFVALLVYDYYAVSKEEGYFTTDFICGMVNAVVFILFIARFENKILDIPPIILCILYIYAILQTSLPFVTGATEFISLHEKVSENSNFIEEFKGIVLTLCLVGKVTLSAVLLYVLNTGRIFYYFMNIHRLHEEEEENWILIKPILQLKNSQEEPFAISFSFQNDGFYEACIPLLFKDKKGRGKTLDEARKDLLKKLKQ